jgi:hypothetical protein
MFRSLLWKEWREHRWKLAGIFLVYLLVVALPRLLISVRPFEVAQTATLALTLFIPGFVALGTVTDERSRRTLSLTRGLPIPAALPFAIKSVFGLTTAVLPPLAAQLIAWYIVFSPADRRTPNAVDLAPWCQIALGAAVSLYAWTTACAARAKNEVRAGLWAAAVLSAYSLVLALEQTDGACGVAGLWEAVTPQGWMAMSTRGRWAQGWGPVGWKSALATGALALGVWRHATATPHHPFRAARGPARRPRALAAASLRFPVLWKTWRELRLLVLGYLAAAVAFALAVAAASVYAGGRWNYEYYRNNPLARVLNQLTLTDVDAALSYCGLTSLFVSLLIGAEVGLGDFDRRLDRFWQSRPIRQARYFWTRFLLAGGLVIGCVVAPPLLLQHACSWQASHVRLGEAWRWLRWAETARRTLLPAACNGITAFALAAFVAAFFRRRVPSLAIAAGLALTQSLLLTFSISHHSSTLPSAIAQAYLYYRSAPLQPTRQAELIAEVVATLAAVGLLGWLAQLAFQYDWKSRLETAVRNLYDRRFARPAARPAATP